MTAAGIMSVIDFRAERGPRKLIIVLAGLFLFSCSHAPATNKNSTSDAQTRAAKTETPQKVRGTGPEPGDVRVVDGVEYVYGKNPRYMTNQIEPLYVWLRTDQYSPGMFDTSPARVSKEEKDLEERLAKLEEEWKRRQNPPQMAPAPRPAAEPPMPMRAVSMPTTPSTPSKTAPSYPSPKMRRRVLILPITGAKDPKSEQLAALTTQRFIARLESTGMILCLDPGTVGYRGDVAQPGAMKALDELYGVQAVVESTFTDITTTSNMKLSVTVYNAETRSILRQLNGSVALPTREQDSGSEAERMRQIDRDIEPIAGGILGSILSLDWHARVASTEKGKIFINAGRLSGLEKGDTLEVYTAGEEIVDAATKTPLGKLKGVYRGEIEIAEFFGMDASWARPKSGENFSPTDLVYLKR